MSVSTQIHGSCVSLAQRGVLLLGASGSGKSDLCLRLIDAGGRLVADDRVILEVEAGGLIARAPERLAGLIEIRGLGVMRVAFERQSPVELAVAASASPERLPEPAWVDYLGVRIPLLHLNLLHASTPAKIRLWLDAQAVPVHRVATGES